MSEANDGVRRADNASLRSRYDVWIHLAEHRNHKGVSVGLFHDERLGDELYRAILSPLDWEDGYLQSAADDTFSQDEVEILRTWFTPNLGMEDRFMVSPCEPIAENCMGFGAIPVGGYSDIMIFTEAPFPLRGHYDLRHAESGLYARRPEEASLKVSRDENGNVVVKRPPL